MARSVLVMSTPQGTALLNIPEVAAELRVSRSTVYRYIDDGLLGTVHIGPRRLTRVTREALADFIAKSAKAA
jgi:excisionase family DNA binding protein